MYNAKMYRERRLRQQPLTPLRRLYYGLLAALTGLLLGGGLDLVFAVLQSLFAASSDGRVHWFLCWWLAAAGALAGLIAGPQAAGLFTGLFHPAEEGREMQNFWVRSLIRALLAGVVLWLVVWVFLT